MKKYIYLIFAALSALLLLSACQREKPVEVKKPALKVVSSNVVFGVEGGEGTIVVEADGTVSVTSERPWVQTSVNGNTITVTVSELNPNPQSRYSRLTIQAGSEKTYVTVHQFGEIFDGMKMEDVTVASAGTTMRYGFKANMTVNVTADQPWVHCAMDEENEGVLIITVDKHEGFGTRFANVSFTAGTNSGSMKITQEPNYGTVSGWTVEDTDGRFVFPDQIDVIKVTPPSDMATAPYYWGVLDPSELAGKDIPAFIRELAT
ncbi:MAG: BACON domain-containing protein, partial [Bacteroidales bacterium]|nr:BACON domain-containing protein [Bacteroidales bacterium]